MYLQQLVTVSLWALFIICFLAHFSITDPSVCPRVSFFVSFRLYVCSFFFRLSLLLFPNSESKWYLFGIIFCFFFEETPRRRRCHCAVVCPRPHRTLTHRSFDILIFCFFVLISVWKAVLTLTSFTKITPEPMSTTFDHCEHSAMPEDRRAEKK